MGNSFVDVDTQGLTSAGSSSDNAAEQVQQLYDALKATVDQVTDTSSWKGEASTAFLERFEALRPQLEADLNSLNRLGTTLKDISNGYETTEAENSSMMGGNDRYEG
jgi:WXG100 family type VII secretion target